MPLVHTNAISCEEVFVMEKTNTSIKCTVSNCAYNNGTENYCTLDTIKVGTCGTAATKPEGTECDSFKLGQNK